MAKYVAIIFALVFIAAVYLLTGEPLAVLGAAIAVSFGVVLYRQKLNDSWRGTITEQKEEKYIQKDYDENDNVTTYEEYRTYSYVRLDNGKVKKMELGPEWLIGDVIEKRKGEYGFRKR
ncbi:PEP-CTERM sorting domain-containing protein [Methanolobus psychrotolerans]|uniref:PEP-CTERM sorting domain-containing protein n=1 Tax=Methanolobus psychrotolerans TaxID=1874706 RepID=UPI000B91CB79|nr:PEP-CTERM sorting domain-containing protein [Methanolobus psychrotolerans]